MEDVIYTESVPFRDNEGAKIYKAGVNVFYPAAHGTRNHDRRIPSGFLISVNAPGHFLRLALNSGVYPNETQVLDDIKNMTIQSVGHRGMLHPEKLSTTWHAETKTDRYGFPVQYGYASYYSVFYHTDVLISGALTCDNRQATGIKASDKLIFKWNIFFTSHLNTSHTKTLIMVSLLVFLFVTRLNSSIHFRRAGLKMVLFIR